ncbi:MAG: hypothetical protein ABTR92_21715 [Candidatus Accumulibacter phosphatis]|jgi:hypothetical protein
MNDQKRVDEAVITHADFVLICQVEDEEDFGGFVVKPDGVYVKAFDKHLLALLSPEERHELLWHPTGRYDEPALPLPCSLPELRAFEDESGLAGSIDEDLLAEVLAAKRKNHTEQPTRPAPAIKLASKAPPPPLHLRGSSPSWVGRPPAVRPSWEEWLMMDRVSIYEAAALSLDLEPRKLERDNRYSFPDEPTLEKYQMRARIIDDGDWSALGRNEFMVRLPAFAAWAIAKGMDIPAELRELAASAKVREQPASNAPGANHQAAPEVSTADDTAQAVALAGITKREILGVEWPLPTGSPTLQNILNELPKWVTDAYTKVGRPGKGVNGSHLWNPAILAVCLATTTPQKKWKAGKGALTALLRRSFPEYLQQWEEAADKL